MHVTIDVPVPLPAAAYATLLRDAVFVRFRTSVPGASVDDVVVTPTGGESFTVTVRRSVSAEQIPPQVRSFVGSELEIRQVEAWDGERDGSWHGTVALEITGTPVRLTGTVALVPSGEGALLTYDGEVRASIPLFGSAVERSAAEAVRATLAAEEVRVQAWVDVHGTPA
ncbi:DUF2505 domain-containing protein [Sanguibacter sp. HDW7]|uniref:DUF2505 domain-containing protein n=1 Tax=Sanguibacter sp. HDW7 TaxID=2714931 RepID=UPI00140CFFBD|nr:DUF2505 domain-containing protein [Sanguibacter sp. HDW7]QIK84150.1 DUF2505 domain-containing protein [Sanguibacter sp. HDW7]